MATALIMPKQGQSVESCAILGWKKKVGDAVKAGEAVCEVETDKAAFEVESPIAGTLLAIFHEAGDQVPVLEAIAAMGSSTGTCAPASWKIASSVPPAGDSTSKVALSVSTSQRTSPAFTGSPTFFFQPTMAQLSTDCPCLGMMSAVAIMESL